MIALLLILCALFAIGLLLAAAVEAVQLVWSRRRGGRK